MRPRPSASASVTDEQRPSSAPTPESFGSAPTASASAPALASSGWSLGKERVRLKHVLAMTEQLLMAWRDRRLEQARTLLREFRIDNWLKLQIDRDWDKLVAAPDLLQGYQGLKDVHVAALRNIIQSRVV